LLLAGCAAQPIDLKIPKDHPANPRAAVTSPGNSNYIYALPIPSNLPEKASVINRRYGEMTKGSDDNDAEAQHPNQKVMHPNTHGKANGD